MKRRSLRLARRFLNRLHFDPPGRLPRGAGITERYQAVLPLIPQREPHAPQTLAQGEPADWAELGTIAQHLRQAIIRNTTAKMVHVVNADIGGYPAQHR